MPIRLIVAFAFLAALAAPALAQQVPATFLPNPAPQGSIVRMGFDLLSRPGCGEVISSTVSVSGNAVRVDYVLGLPPGIICFATPPPGTPVLIDLGGFAPGNYVVTAVGVDLVYQTPPPVVTGSFGVVATSSVPASSPNSTALLAFAALIAGLALLARRRVRSG